MLKYDARFAASEWFYILQFVEFMKNVINSLWVHFENVTKLNSTSSRSMGLMIDRGLKFDFRLEFQSW